MRGYDQATNVILSSAEERVFSSTEAVQVEPLGVYLLRGDNVYGKFIDREMLGPLMTGRALIGETELEIDSQVNWSEVRADPVPELRHFQ